MTNFFLVFFRISLSASPVVLALLLLSTLLNRRYASKWTYWIWLFLAFRLILPLDGSGLAGELTRFGTPYVQEAGHTNTEHPVTQAAPRGQFTVEIPARMTEPLSASFPESNIAVTWLDLAALVWAMGAMLFLSVHLASYLYYKRQIGKKGIRVRDADILCRIEELRREFSIKGAVHAVQFPEASSPMIIGFFKTVLVLPGERYTREELSFILKHELIHCKRKDVCARLLFAAANAVHWYNPLIWGMRKAAAVDMELSCDERVTQGADYAERKAYTETLLSALRKNTAKCSFLTTQFNGGVEIMKKRFRNILDAGGRKNGVLILTGAAVLTIALGTVIGCTVSQAHNDNTPERTETAIPDQGQIYGYLSEFDGTSATVDRQFWVTSEDEDWKPEYNDAAGFEVVDAEGEDIRYPVSEGCTYSALENHYDPVLELSREEFERYLAEMEYPVLWILQLQDGQVINIREQYVP